MGIKERKQRQFEKREALILETARKLFLQKGFVNFTLDDIADEIEYSKGTIYSHFESKEEIYARILMEQLNVLHLYLQEAVNNSQNTEDGIKRCLDAYLTFYTQHKEYFRLLFFIDMVSAGLRIPHQLLKEIQMKKHACLSELERVLKKGKEAKELAGNLNETKIAMVLWGMLNGMLQLAESRHIKFSELPALIEVGFDIVFKGLIKRKNKNKVV